jgi:TrbC/VIRB2 pilin
MLFRSKRGFMKFNLSGATQFGFLWMLLAPAIASASVESSLMAVQSKLTNTILPLVGILGLVFAAFSFFTGSQNARSHLILAIMGAVVGFGAPAIIQFVQALIH